MADNLDLANIFGAVTQALAENQQTLNQADEYNRDHGNNMVQTFQTITSALKKQQKKGSSESAALRYAARQLSKKSTSGSGKLYAENLAQAADQFKGKSIDSRGALDLLGTLIGGQTQSSGQPGGDMLGALLGMAGGGSQTMQQPAQTGGDDMLGALLGGLTGGNQPMQQPAPSGGGDLLGSLLGGLAGGGAQPEQQSSQSGGGDLLGALLGGMSGSGSQSSSGGPNMLKAIMAFMKAKSSGGSTAQALIQAFLASSRMGDAPQRTQSTELVVNSFLQALNTAVDR